MPQAGAQLRPVIVEPLVDHDVRGHSRQLKHHPLIPKRDHFSYFVPSQERTQPFQLAFRFHDEAGHGLAVGDGDEPFFPWGGKEPEEVAGLIRDGIIDVIIIGAVDKFELPIVFAVDIETERGGQIRIFDIGYRFAG